MKKIGTYFSIFLISIVVFLLGFNYQTTKQPYTYYQVYLDNELLGIIKSKNELEKYINKQGNQIRSNVKEYSLMLNAYDTFNKYKDNGELSSYSNLDKVKYILSHKKEYKLADMDIDNLNFYKKEKIYNLSSNDISNMRDYLELNKIYLSVNKVYTPNGIEIKKTYTYDANITSVEEMYKQIIGKKSCTIAGYKFTIKSKTEGVKDITIYTTDKDIFDNAIDDLIKIFVDNDKYEAYKKNNQSDISTTGSLIENIYLEEDITFKAINISTSEKIYTNSKDLSAHLLYGDNHEEKEVTVKSGDSIESISYDNQISVQEFLISNSKYTSRENLLVPGSKVVISRLDPKIQVVVETYEVVDKETAFSTVEQYDPNLSQGSAVVTQEGERGIERVTQNIKSINGQISYVDPVDKQTIKSPVSKIISIGTKYIPTIGSTASWGWPTNSGYTISSYYGYRLAVYGEGNFHTGIDIAGTGYGSPVYASNNGVIEVLKSSYSAYGKHIIINHNNGYYTLYAHMSGFASGISVGSTVSRGQVIGYVGATGWATGPHLHFEVRTCLKDTCLINPLRFLSR